MPTLPAMRPPLARHAAVAPVLDTAQETYLTRHGRARSEPRWVQEQRDWETSARAYARFNGPAAFNALVISDMCARCDIRVEEQDAAGDWPETERPELVHVLDEYKNKWQNMHDLVRAHAWRYNVDGHGFMCFWDGETGVEYGMFSTTHVELNKPLHGQCTVKLITAGRVDDGTAFVLPMEQAFHVWIPDNEDLLRPTSPMMSSIEDLHRYRALTRYAWRTAESRLAMEGLLWVPSEVGREDGAPLDPEDEQADGIGQPQSSFEEKYYELAKLSFDNNDDIAAIAPPIVSWEADLGKPEWVQIGKGLDPQGILERRNAIEDAARPWPVPTTALMGGGVGDANHWSEWLASDKFVDSGVRPNMDRICHMDLTRVFLVRRLRWEGYAPSEIARFRVGYDPQPIIVQKNKPDLALKLAGIGAIGYVPLLKACGFEPGDLPTAADEERLLSFISKGRLGEQITVTSTGLPDSSATVTQGPPLQPTSPPNLAEQGPPAQKVPALAASVDVVPTPTEVAAILGAAFVAMVADGDGG